VTKKKSFITLTPGLNPTSKRVGGERAALEAVGIEHSGNKAGRYQLAGMSLSLELLGSA